MCGKGQQMDRDEARPALWGKVALFELHACAEPRNRDIPEAPANRVGSRRKRLPGQVQSMLGEIGVNRPPRKWRAGNDLLCDPGNPLTQLGPMFHMYYLGLSKSCYQINTQKHSSSILPRIPVSFVIQTILNKSYLEKKFKALCHLHFPVIKSTEVSSLPAPSPMLHSDLRTRPSGLQLVGPWGTAASPTNPAVTYAMTSTD